MANTFKANNLSELEGVAKELIPIIQDKPLVAFYGKMGAGKTTLIKALCKELQVQNVVASPTFALVNEYTTAQEKTIYHFDLYRINKIEELFDLGYEEYFYSGNYCFIEWPELAEDILPAEVLNITIEVDNKGKRTITVV
jgi:tRNA threonylcarbamoyladenosine biosynthesis protein TsaE